MKKFSLPIFVMLGLLFVLAACNFPVGNNQTDNSAAETAVVQTVSAQLTQSAFSTALAQLTPVTQNTPTLTVVTAIPTPTLPVVAPTQPGIAPSPTAYTPPIATTGPTATPTPL
ncbi:MAG TPA: hypothetical protein PKH92_08975, partial [Anaerolineaceae bacterium]|nr:hypothetical protein [Anaerolineaceae bacterium]